MRAKADENFGKIFKGTRAVAKQLHGEDFELKESRLNARQAHRANVTVYSAEEYFRITYNEFLSHIVTELEQRFSGSQCQTLGLLELLPELCSDRKDTDIPDELDQVVAFTPSSYAASGASNVGHEVVVILLKSLLMPLKLVMPRLFPTFTFF